MKKKIAVCGNGWSNEYIEIVLSGIRKCAMDNNADIFFLFNFSVMDPEDYTKIGHLNINRLLEFGEFDGIILLANTFHLQEEFDYLCKIIKEKQIPSVSLEYHLPGIDFFGSDNYSGMHELCTHLIEHHQLKNFAFVSGPKGNAESDIRRKAMEDVLAKHSLSLTEENIIYGNWNYYEVQQKLPQWLQEHALPDVFICANDVMAMAACSVLQENDISVPADVKVTGFDHLLSARTHYPTIASVDRNWDNMGYQSLQYLFDKIAGKASICERYVNSYAVPGESCGCNPSNTISINKRIGSCNSYANYVRNTFWSGHLYDITDCLSMINTEEELHTTFSNYLKNDHAYEKDEVYFCLADNFFSSLKDGPPLLKMGYTDKLDVICGLKDGQPIARMTFDTKDLVPYYDANSDGGRMYVLIPLYSIEGSYGYAVFGDEIPMMYDYSIYHWMRSISQNFNRVRQNIMIGKLNKQLEKLSVTDGLTGVYNRLGCEKFAYPYLEQQHAQGKNTVLMFADINKMKEINDVYGHIQGDTAICTVANVISEVLTDEWIVVRYGGDEFLMVGEYSEKRHPSQLSQDINDYLKETVQKMQLPYPLNIGIGYVIIPSTEELNLSERLKEADDSMYIMKKKLKET